MMRFVVFVIVYSEDFIYEVNIIVMNFMRIDVYNGVYIG